MIIGVPTEIQPNENRIGLSPSGACLLVRKGHKVLIEKNAGINSGFSNEEYEKCGAEIVNTPKEIYAAANMILKVKAPKLSEYNLMRKDQIIMCFLHLLSDTELTRVLQKGHVTSIAYESIQKSDGTMPVLNPMSEIAGKMSIQIGAQFLENHNGGSGVLLGGVVGTKPGKVVIIGAGTVGKNAAQIAVGYGANVSVLDINIEKLRHLNDIFYSRIKTIIANPFTIEKELKDADLVISAVLVPGEKTPIVITEDMVKQMKQGSVIIDVSVDQGGSVETVNRITIHENPTFIKHGVIHYAVSNMPGTVAKTSSIALTNGTLPYIMAIANDGIKAVKKDPSLAKAVCTIDGNITCKNIADSISKEYTPLESIIGF